jgi:branched-subunit amino acid ABC-type transport system permease component
LAVGDDPAAAELAGVDVQGTLLSVYVLAGLICALAGWMLIGRIGSVSPTSGQTANIESITAVVIGGISLFGGKVFRTVIAKSVRLEESPAYKESIFTFAPGSSGATDYYSLCEEVIERVEARTT